MRATIVISTVLFCVSIVPGDGFAQGTKDPSNPVPTMVTPIRPRDEPQRARPLVVPNNNYGAPIRLRRLHPFRVRR
jgi:hypothetical protein